MSDDSRLDELAANLADVRGRVDAACRDAGRDPTDVTLVVVTKTWPADDVRRLALLGVTDVGENRDQEAGPKQALAHDLPIRWHFIGQLQRNKAKSVARYADVVESVDRPGLVAALAAARDPERPMDVLLQVSLDGSTDRGGSLPEDIPELAELVEQAPSLRLAGLMAVAPLGEDPDRAFARLAMISADLLGHHPEARVLSAGMSGDLEAAIRHGATQVRVGSAVLGHRPRVG